MRLNLFCCSVHTIPVDGPPRLECDESCERRPQSCSSSFPSFSTCSSCLPQKRSAEGSGNQSTYYPACTTSSAILFWCMTTISLLAPGSEAYTRHWLIKAHTTPVRPKSPCCNLPIKPLIFNSHCFHFFC